MSEAKYAELTERMAEHEHVRQIQIMEGSERRAGKSGRLDVVGIKGHFEHIVIQKEGMI